MTTVDQLTDEQTRALHTLATATNNDGQVGADDYTAGEERARMRLRGLLAHDDRGHRIRLWVDNRLGGNASEEHGRGYGEIQDRARRVLAGHPSEIRGLLGAVHAAAGVNVDAIREDIDEWNTVAAREHLIYPRTTLDAVRRVREVHVPALLALVDELTAQRNKARRERTAAQRFTSDAYRTRDNANASIARVREMCAFLADRPGFGSDVSLILAALDGAAPNANGETAPETARDGAAHPESRETGGTPAL